MRRHSLIIGTEVGKRGQKNRPLGPMAPGLVYNTIEENSESVEKRKKENSESVEKRKKENSG